MNRIFYTILSILLFYSIANGQSAKNIYKSGRVQKGDFEYKVRFTISNGKYILQNVKVENVVGNYILDTGTDITIISEKLSNSIKLEIKGEEILSDSENEFSAKYGFADIKIGNVNFYNIAICVVSNLDSLICGVDGIIGNNLIQKCVWQLSKSEITISNKVSKEKKKDYKKNKLLLIGGAPHFLAKLSVPRATFLFDLGDNGFVAVGKEITKHIKPKKEINGYGKSLLRIFDNDTKTYLNDSKAMLLDTFYVFDYKIINPISYVDMGKEIYSVSIGSEFLNYFDIILDYKNKKVYSKQIEKQYKSEHWNNFGFKYIIENKLVMVRFIWQNSSAEKVGIKPGERILKINSLDLTNSISICQTYTKIETELNTNNKLTIVWQDKTGKQHTAELLKTDLFLDN